MASGDLFYEKLVRVLPTLTDRKRALHIVYDIETEVSTYVLTLTAINAGLGIAVAVTFHALGMPAPYLWGLLTFFLNFIPYVGAVTGVRIVGFHGDRHLRFPGLRASHTPGFRGVVACSNPNL